MVLSSRVKQLVWAGPGAGGLHSSPKSLVTSQSGMFWPFFYQLAERGVQSGIPCQTDKGMGLCDVWTGEHHQLARVHI